MKKKVGRPPITEEERKQTAANLEAMNKMKSKMYEKEAKHKAISMKASKYKDFMPAQIVEMFSQGGTAAGFCAHHNISQRAFDDWQEVHPEFKEAYAEAKLAGTAQHLELARQYLVQEPDGPKLDTKLWSMLGRNVYGLTDKRKVKVDGIEKAKTFSEQIVTLMRSVGRGELTDTEASNIAKLIETGAKVHETTELTKRVEEIEQGQRSNVHGAEFKEE